MLVQVRALDTFTTLVFANAALVRDEGAAKYSLTAGAQAKK